MLKNILVKITEVINAKNTTVKKYKKGYSGETIRFSSTSTLLESKGSEQIGWSVKRYFQRRGVLILSNRRFYFSSNFFSLMSVLWLIFIVYCVNMGVTNGDVIWYILALMFLIFIIQRRPYKADIPLNVVIDIKIGFVRGMVGYRASLITVVTKEKSYNFCTAKKFGFTKDDILSAI